jgi:hypothetical protein
MTQNILRTRWFCRLPRSAEGIRQAIRATLGVTALLACVWSASPAHAQAPTGPTPLMSTFQVSRALSPGGTFDFSASSPGGSRLGAFRLGRSALRDAGFLDDDGGWSALAQSMGVDSDAAFLGNKAAQIVADRNFAAASLSALQAAMGSQAYAAQLDRPDRGRVAAMTAPAMTYCAESLGAAGCASYLSTGIVPAALLAGSPDWRDGGWQRGLAIMSRTALPVSSPVLSEQPMKTDANGWAHVQQMNVLQPTPDQAWVAGMWHLYGGRPLSGAIALPLTYQVYEHSGEKVLVGVALSQSCDMGANGIGATLAPAVCPVTVISVTDKGVQAHAYAGACYLWTANEPAGADTDPVQNATYLRFDPSSRMVDVLTTRHGKPIPECSKRVAF